MSIIIKTKDEIEKLTVAGKRLARVVAATAAMVSPGITTSELDKFAEKMIRDMGDEPAFLNYQPDSASMPFPCTLCVSINEEVVHGMASDRVLKEGDIISVDCGLKHRGVYVDHAVTVGVGNIDARSQKLIDDTSKSLELGIEAVTVAGNIGDIGAAIQGFVGGRYGIVRVLAGHGVGREIHEDPYVPNFGKAGSGPRIVSGMVIAIEPMLNLGTEEVIFLDDGYTVITADRKRSAHFEHTVLITENGPEILTLV